MLRHGKGILDIVGGLRYEGNWSKNYMDGKGFAVMCNMSLFPLLTIYIYRSTLEDRPTKDHSGWDFEKEEDQ